MVQQLFQVGPADLATLPCNVDKDSLQCRLLRAGWFGGDLWEDRIISRKFTYQFVTSALPVHPPWPVPFPRRFPWGKKERSKLRSELHQPLQLNSLHVVSRFREHSNQEFAILIRIERRWNDEIVTGWQLEATTHFAQIDKCR